jgi:hypothetical protein
MHQLFLEFYFSHYYYSNSLRQNLHMKFRLFIFLLSATAADECCSAGSTAHHPVQTTQPLASVGLFVSAASPVI